MGRFAPRYTDQQRDAVAAAILNEGRSPKQAVQALAAGDLDAEPIDMPWETARTLARAARYQDGRTANTNNPGEALAQLVARHLRLAYTETQKLEQASRDGALDPDHWTKVLKALESVDKLAKANVGKRKPDDQDQDEKPQSAVAQLAAKLPQDQQEAA